MKIPGAPMAFSSFTKMMFDMYAFFIRRGNRDGQAWMNALREVDPELYTMLTGTSVDCFNNDNLVSAFKAELFGGTL